MACTQFLLLEPFCVIPLYLEHAYRNTAFCLSRSVQLFFLDIYDYQVFFV